MKKRRLPCAAGLRWRATLRRSSHGRRAALHTMIGGALLATPLADRPKGVWIHAKSYTHHSKMRVITFNLIIATFALTSCATKDITTRSIVLARLSRYSRRFRGGCYDGRRRSADAELWRPSQPDVARGEQGRSRERSPPPPGGDVSPRHEHILPFGTVLCEFSVRIEDSVKTNRNQIFTGRKSAGLEVRQ